MAKWAETPNKLAEDEEAAREAILDEIEEIISETHDIDVRDRHYAENIVRWLERHHRPALAALHAAFSSSPAETPTDPAAQYLILKRGLYYRPNAQGYTGAKCEAGRYTEADARARTHPNGIAGPRDGMSFIHQDDAPDFSPACCSDVKARIQAARIEELERQLAEAREALMLIDGFLENKGHSEHDPLIRGAIRAALTDGGGDAD